MNASKSLLAVSVLAFTGMASFAALAQQPSTDGPRFVGTALARPTDYREWVFLGSSLGLTYAPPTRAVSSPSFGNVFVTPSSYRSFLQTGKWPDHTMFVLEIRRSGTEAAVVKDGRFQTDLLSLESEVKDSRYPDGWAYFNFGPASALKSATEPLPADGGNPGQESCVECHTNRTAVERTFVQFYPVLLDVARQKGTLKPGF
jgi:hypothetical protein